MYGLKKVAILTYENLQKYLVQYGYQLIQGTVGMW